MACVTNVNYFVIINGYPSKFFRVGRGLRQGCSISPLLFILVMDGLSFHIKKAVLDGQFLSLHMGNYIKISHSFFVDDVLIMGMLNRFSWLTLFHVFSKLLMLLDYIRIFKIPLYIMATATWRY